MSAKTVEEYIDGLGGWKSDVVGQLRGIVMAAVPAAQESIKWAQPVFEINGPFCYIKAFKNSVNFGFWRGVELEDGQGLLQGSGEKMRHVKLTGVEDIHEDAFRAFVEQAVQLNQQKGDPTKGKS